MRHTARFVTAACSQKHCKRNDGALLQFSLKGAGNSRLQKRQIIALANMVSAQNGHSLVDGAELASERPPCNGALSTRRRRGAGSDCAGASPGAMKPTISSASGPSRTPAPNQPQPLRFLLDAIIAAPTPHNSQTNTPRNIRGNARLMSADQLFEPVPQHAPTALKLQAVLYVIFHGRTASISEPPRAAHDST